MTTPRLLLPSVCLLTLGLACADPGSGEVEVRVYGEEFIELGISAEDLADGWAIEFERFEVTLADVEVAEAAVASPEPFDLTAASEGRGQQVGRASATAGDFSDASFAITRVHVVGSASKAGESKQFDWLFEQRTDYANCETTTTVPDGGVGEFQITVHADHLFYDSLVAEEPALRFDPIAAADSDGDGVITAAELEATDLGAYDPGNLAIDDLWAFLAAQAGSMGHVDGEGHCDAS